ncbi:glycosyltransferase family 39 protein [Sporolactobacillus pectinivorans]|uniref:glycosyltransferase family 39 protein n=1 Tax=Sporolactobacillus pectinivorans TaxID=1591408 RepID=UPI000C26B04F|nr:glycosyltransferase family 39 protein [Sporolactobacillus pectinivorans]
MSNLLNRTIVYLFLIILAFIISLNILFTRGYQSIGLSAPFLFKAATLLLSCLMIASLYYYRRQIVRLIQRVPMNRSAAVLLIFSVCLQFLAVVFLCVHPSWDFGVVVKSARLLAEGGKINHYFEYYPNNLLVVILLALIDRLPVSPIISDLVFNIANITFSQYLIYRITAKLAGKPAGILSLMASVLFFPFIFYAPIVYTDTLSLVFLLIPVSLLMERSGAFRSGFKFIIAASFILALGVLLKGSMIVFVIAFSLTMLISFRRWKKVYVFLPLITLFIIQFIFNFCIYESGVADRQQTEQLKFPVTHWLLMGQNQPHYGKYLESDVLRTKRQLQKYPHKEVTRIQLNELRERISKKGWQGNIRFLIEKNAETWTDGTFYTLNVLKRKPVFPQNFKFLMHHPVDWFVQGYARIQLLVLLTGVFLAGIPYLKRKSVSPFLTFSMASVIGFFLFLIIWETRSRYLVSLTPILIIISVVGYFDSFFNGGQTEDR